LLQYSSSISRSKEDIIEAQLEVTRHLKYLSDFLGGKQYFFGNKPSSLDAEAFGLLAMILYAKTKTDLSGRITEYLNLYDYVRKMLVNCFSILPPEISVNIKPYSRDELISRHHIERKIYEEKLKGITLFVIGISAFIIPLFYV